MAWIGGITSLKQEDDAGAVPVLKVIFMSLFIVLSTVV